MASGAGMLVFTGVLVLMVSGAGMLIFLAQDFNEEVLKQLTMPNVIANLQRLPTGSSRPSCRFFSGDWSSVGELLTNQVSLAAQHPCPECQAKGFRLQEQLVY